MFWMLYTSLCSAAKLDAIAEDVDDLSLSFVTPLGAEYDDGGHCAAGCDCAVVDCFVVVLRAPLFQEERIVSLKDLKVVTDRPHRPITDWRGSGARISDVHEQG